MSQDAADVDEEQLGVSVASPAHSELQQRITHHVTVGTFLELSDGEDAESSTMDSWGPERTVDAEFVRDLLRGRHVHEPDPHGLQLRGARVDGRLDLVGLKTSIRLTLRDCYFPAGLDASNAELEHLDLSGSRLDCMAGSAFQGDGLRVKSDLDLAHTTITTAGEHPAVRLHSAHVAGHLSMIGATLTGSETDGVSLVADNLRVDSSVLLDGGFTAAGALRLNGAHIAGQLSMRGAKLNGSDAVGNSLVADTLRADSDAVLDEGFTAAGALRLIGAHIAGRVSMSGATLNGSDADGDSLVADNLRADSDVVLDEGFTAAGALRLIGAHVAGQLNMCGATLNGSDADGNSLVADNLQADSDVFLDEGFAAGALRLNGAHVAGDLNMCGATLNGSDADGDSLVADNLQADSDVILGEGFTAAGALRLNGAHVAGDLNMRGATLNGSNADGDSLLADNLKASRSLLLDEGFTATGAVRLPGAQIWDLVVSQKQSALPSLGAATGWKLADVQGVVRHDRKAASEWLSSQDTAQPWQELAAVYERNGQPSDARWTRYRSAVRSTPPFRQEPLACVARRSYRYTTGHGYYPMAALGWLLLIFAMSFVLTLVWADDFTTASTPLIRADLAARSNADASATSTGDSPTRGLPLPGRVPNAWCSSAWDSGCLSAPAQAIATALPAGALVQAWQPPTGYPTLVFAALRLFAWVFTALLLAGVTGLLRRQI